MTSNPYQPPDELTEEPDAAKPTNSEAFWILIPGFTLMIAWGWALFSGYLLLAGILPLLASVPFLIFISQSDQR
ncbi:hypothetical protein [Neorhodopirellula pilleata]|uniref:Uncharacterized protein n=1 Tax=Neorhodopirellula pilleata TaxID=2714738 RepID=A0A5C5ZZ75_9BACT|nr:hypothetical protein [Neorhodopirellula pilleata]TWT91623.1 hypothetical protein Pla100_50140 [Neorhodopirellula pilleata]